MIKENFENFIRSDFGLEIWSKEKLIFRSKKEGIKGLSEFITEFSRSENEGKEENKVLFAKKNKKSAKDLIIFDKKVGNAIALLSVYIGAKEVFGVVGSKSAKKTFKKYKIKFHFLKTILRILNKKGTDICPLEKLSFLKTPKEFYDLVKGIKFINIRDPKSLEFTAAIDIHRESLPTMVQEPPIGFKDGLLKKKKGILKKNKTTYHLIGLKYGNQMIGMADFSYFWEENLGFIGYIVIKPEFQGQGLGSILFQKILSMVSDDAKKINKKVKGIVLELEKEENVRGIKFFQKQGAFIIKGIDYWQPPFYNLPALPLYLMALPLDRKYWNPLTRKKIIEIIKVIYEKNYILESDVPRPVAMGFLRKIISSTKPKELKTKGLEL